MTKVVLAAALAGVIFSQQAPGRTEGRQVPAGSTAEQPAPQHPRYDPWGGVFVVQGTKPAAGGATATVQSVPPPELEGRTLAEAHLRALRESLESRTPAVERGPCNMPIVRANPAVDPKMVVPLRTEGVDAKIRVIETGVCGKLTEAQIR